MSMVGVDPVWRPRCITSEGEWVIHVKAAVPAEVLGTRVRAWGPGVGWVELVAGTLFAYPMEGGKVKVLACTLRERVGDRRRGGLETVLVSLEMGQVELLGEDGYARWPERLSGLCGWRAAAHHPCVEYFTDVTRLRERVEEAHQGSALSVDGVRPGWLERPSEGAAFRWHAIVPDSAAFEHGELASGDVPWVGYELEACAGCDEPLVPGLHRDAWKLLGLDRHAVEYADACRVKELGTEEPPF